jgi:hypothetical protein
MTDPFKEKRESETMLGRRKTDHANGQLQWLAEHFNTVIDTAVASAEDRWITVLDELLQKALRGDIPAQIVVLREAIEALKKANETRHLHTAAIALACSMLGGGSVVLFLVFTGAVRF